MIKKPIVLLLLCITILPVFAANGELYAVLEQEFDREFREFSNKDSNLYYMDYRVDVVKAYSLSAAFGYLTGDEQNEISYCTISMRYGNHEFDNTHLLKGGRRSSNTLAFVIPSNSSEGIRQTIWFNACNLFERVKSEYIQLKNTMKAEDISKQNDFSNEPPNVYKEPENEIPFPDGQREIWKERLIKYSRPFAESDVIISGNAGLDYLEQRTYFFNSEGSRIVQNKNAAMLNLIGVIKSEDGDYTPYHRNFIAESPDQLPSDSELTEAAMEVKSMLLKLNEAPLADPYAGPVIMSPMASGVFFHEIFGHRLEGHRLKDENNGNTFKNKLNKMVLPKTFNVWFDPTQNYLSNTYLNGHYAYDDEGVKARRVDVIERGVLKTFLMNRTPAPGLPHSNGHGRASAGQSPVARQSNMFIESVKPLSDSKLKNKLIKECKKQKKEYGYYIKTVSGGFTNNSRYTPNVFNVTPTEVYRIYVDGRPDELVRGVNFIGTPLAMFSEITAAGETPGIFNGFCGAESGSVPVATIAPSLFIKKVETQRSAQTFSKPVILPSPKSAKQEQP
ncbi:TldD/PmbA family protein [Saccharicrinis sp. FJH54]|uniref:TldD/PmbA family protein n=1 Tax=Saccharicrinis sp. FJH54 TaxID=3344665 RepID=UPI0035D43F8E